MKINLEKIDLFNFDLENGARRPYIPLFYQIFGQPLGTAPIVVVNHALTGNSNVLGEKGWWSELFGKGKSIDTQFFTIIAFNIPGNGYDGIFGNLIINYHDYNLRDVARMFWEGLDFLKIEEVFAIIGGSLGGAIAWEMTAIHPKKVQNLIPIASDWKATDWVIANVLIQDQILNNSDDPIADARLHAMLLYRTPQSINKRFQRSKCQNLEVYQIENWLVNHGIKLKNRFRLSSYKLLNHLLKTNDITRDRADFLTQMKSINTCIHLISVDTDYFFVADENREAFEQMQTVKENVYYHEINSIHGHDAFLMENEQLAQILKPIFNKQKKYNYVST